MTCHGVKCPSLHDRLPLWSYLPFILPEFCLFFSCKVNRTSSATKMSAAPPDLFSKKHLERYLLTAQFCFVSGQVTFCTLTNQPQKLQKWSLLRPLQVIHNLLIKLGSSKKFEVYSCGIYSHREEPVFSCLESAFLFLFQANNKGWWWSWLSSWLQSGGQHITNAITTTTLCHAGHHYSRALYRPMKSFHIT